MGNDFILIAEDDADDRFLLQTAFEENGFKETLHFVENGLELMHFLNKLVDDSVQPPLLPKFIMLDLNMPKKDGREVLRELKESDSLNNIPVVIFSTTNNEKEMKHCYDLGANSYLTKPSNFDSLLKTVASLHKTWL